MKLGNLSMKVKLFVCAAIFASFDVFSAEPIPPDEMVSMCGSLVTYASIAVQSKQSKIPLPNAIEITEISMKKNLSSLPPEAFKNYSAAVQELYKRIYALQDTSEQAVNREIAPACVVYAENQYTVADITKMQMCQTKSQPYLGFANMRDQGMPLKDQLKWLKETALQGAQEKERLYNELSEVMKYVYANPKKSKEEIYREQFNSCYSAVK